MLHGGPRSTVVGVARVATLALIRGRAGSVDHGKDVSEHDVCAARSACGRVFEAVQSNTTEPAIAQASSLQQLCELAHAWPRPTSHHADTYCASQHSYQQSTILHRSCLLG